MKPTIFLSQNLTREVLWACYRWDEELKDFEDDED